jgi:NAD+ diphosphatase
MTEGMTEGSAGGLAGGSSRPVLSRSTVDRASDRRTDPEWLGKLWVSRGQVLHLDVALSVPASGGGVIPPHLSWVPAVGPMPTEALFLGVDDDAGYFALVGQDLSDPVPGFRRRGLWEIGAELGDRDAGLYVHAMALARWHEGHRFCPRCGAPTVPEHGGSMRRCTVDGSEHFPRTDPAMIVLVTDPSGERAVLARAASWPEKRFSCLAGFVEAGESAEQSVVREVAEEVGLEVTEVHYVDSQPWPFPSSLMLGFRAIAKTGPLVFADGEIAEAVWLTREELNEGIETAQMLLPPAVSIARHLVDVWLAEG